MPPRPADKQTLRDQFRQRRLELSAAQRKLHAEAFTKRALQWFEQYAGSTKVVGGYYPLTEEMDVLPLLKALSKQGKVIAFPAVVGRRGLVFRKVQDFTAKRFEKHGKLGVLEPTVAFPEVVPEVVLTPLLVFDAEGGRVGFGAGYYDRAIAILRRKPYKFLAVGAAFECQKADHVPMSGHDQKLDAVITEAAAYQVRRTTGGVTRL
jgi:5-formyltetrahydrofolate cyclo-ligase